MFSSLITFLHRAIMQGIPLLFGSTGEIMTEKSGNLNLGIPGVMYIGGMSGVIGAFLYENSLESKADAVPFLAVLIPLLCCILGSFFGGPFILLLNRYTPCKSECYRFGAHNFRNRLR